MFITDEAGLLPPWLRFVAGVVDTEDLPLNVSRETLQSTPALARIRRAVTGRVLSELKARSKDPEDYAKFWENFGPVLKEGVWEDAEHRQDVAALLRFRSSAVEGWASLADYVGRMKEGQEAIHILSARTRAPRPLPPVEVSARRAWRCCCSRTASTPSGRSGWPRFDGKSDPQHHPGHGWTFEGRGRRGEAEAPADVGHAWCRCCGTRRRTTSSEVRATGRGWVTARGAWPRRSTARTCRCSACCGGQGAASAAGLPVLEINPRLPADPRLAAGAATDATLPRRRGCCSISRGCRMATCRAIRRHSPGTWRGRSRRAPSEAALAGGNAPSRSPVGRMRTRLRIRG
jgi:molecular chaperone HtpG